MGGAPRPQGDAHPQASGRAVVRPHVHASTNYGNARIAAEPITARRQDNITIVDARLEKVFKVWAGSRFAPFLDLFNMLNANPEQNITWSSGTSFLQPLNIVPPRLVRIGAKFEW
ncbi:MAG TPA: hypothetical protein VGJ39_13860 [Vicinamibacterales bacterium]|jgi:hypothetical protein